MAKKTTDSEQKGNQDLELAVQGINKKFGDGALMRLGECLCDLVWIFGR
jgi:hypothetical protein